ncbi:MAG: hypothetical protein JXA33_24990 [Anaerolineae bacterium]|nr:hypothetical protein [Anaerolineae bacterium]
MIVKRYMNIRMSDGWWWFVGPREPRPCVVWFLLGVLPVFIDQKALKVIDR